MTASAASPNENKLRVTVLCGGPSAEREISLQSGQAIAAALQRKGHHVHTADIGPNDLSALDHPTDVIFPALHGTFGEDGTLQRILEGRRVPFVGSGSEASAWAMDKVRTKEAALELGYKTPAYEVWTPSDVDERDDSTLHLPVIVKPIDQGSSVATSIVKQPDDLRPAIANTAKQFGRALVEEFVPGVEMTCGLVGDRNLPPVCIHHKHDFYDFNTKYYTNDTEYDVKPDYPAEMMERARQQSRGLFKHLGCRHLSRVDWIVDPDHELWLLEINTLPGFTSHSLVPKAAGLIGIEFDELVDLLVHMATESQS
jgi:D-alanine-D-alanine ligase